jgi:hypothetical protein
MWGGLLGVALLAGGLIWLLRGRASKPESRTTRDGLSYEEMEAQEELRRAEEDVRKLDGHVQPEEEQTGDDWGPGTPKSY